MKSDRVEKVCLRYNPGLSFIHSFIHFFGWIMFLLAIAILHMFALMFD
jgi:hypothetical protein